MTKRIKLALVATLIAACPVVAQAQEALDMNTGLRTELFYAPLHELDQQGAPISGRARQYLAENPTVAYGSGYNARAYAPRGGYHARTYAVRRGYDARAYAPVQYPCALDQSHFDSEGAPVGPYCFEH